MTAPVFSLALAVFVPVVLLMSPTLFPSSSSSSQLGGFGVDAFGFGSGGGGGGGGCCCQSACGGRKKRSIIDESMNLNTEQTALCPQAEWKSIIAQNLQEDIVAAEYAIHSAFQREHDGGKWMVTCLSSSSPVMTTQPWSKQQLAFNAKARDGAHAHTVPNTLTDASPPAPPALGNNSGGGGVDGSSDGVIAFRPKALKFASNGVGYCSHGDAKTWCTVMALLG